LILNKKDIKLMINKIMSGSTVESVCSEITLTQSEEDFDKVITDAIHDIWIVTGDTHFNRDGFRKAFDDIEDAFFPKEKIKIEIDDEHLPLDWYF